METAVVWGWILTASWGAMPPIIDVNYNTEADCLEVADAFKAQFPSYDVACTPTWKPDKAVKKRVRRVAPAKRTRTVRR